MHVRTNASAYVPDSIHALVRRDPITHIGICANKTMHTQLTDCITKKQ